MTIIPAPLKPGDTIGVMAPASYIDREDAAAAQTILEARGYKVFIHPQTYAKFNQSAGTSEEKRDAFHDLIGNKDIRAIFFATGGNRTLHWVDHIDFKLVKKNPKIIMGFSACSTLLNIIAAKTGLVTYHGPNLRWFMKHADNVQDTAQCFSLLNGQSTIDLSGAHVMRPGSASGRLFGGNASNTQYLLGDILFKKSILFLEDWNIETSQLDLLFCALKRAGLFEKINGLILGRFENLLDTGRPFGFTLDDIIAEHTAGTHFPILMNAPFGHGDRLMTLPVGQKVELDGCSLTLS